MHHKIDRAMYHSIKTLLSIFTQGHVEGSNQCTTRLIYNCPDDQKRLQEPDLVPHKK